MASSALGNAAGHKRTQCFQRTARGSRFGVAVGYVHVGFLVLHGLWSGGSGQVIIVGLVGHLLWLLPTTSLPHAGIRPTTRCLLFPIRAGQIEPISL
jgi:hypothetical protein